MTHKEAIKTIKSMVYCYEATDDVCEEAGCCMYCEGHTETQQEIDALKVAIEAIEKADKYRWIPCSERLPELYMRKDLWFGGNLYSVGDFCGDYWNADIYRGLSKNEYKIPVIAWRETKPFEEE